MTDIWDRRMAQAAIDSVRMWTEATRESLDRLDAAMRELEKGLGYSTGPESSREEMSPKINGTLDCPSERVAPAR